MKSIPSGHNATRILPTGSLRRGGSAGHQITPPTTASRKSRDIHCTTTHTDYTQNAAVHCDIGQTHTDTKPVQSKRTFSGSSLLSLVAAAKKKPPQKTPTNQATTRGHRDNTRRCTVETNAEPNVNDTRGRRREGKETKPPPDCPVVMMCGRGQVQQRVDQPKSHART